MASYGDERAHALALDASITSLSLIGEGVTDEGALALSISPSLTCLNLKGNRIGAEGAKALSRSTTITSLNLAANTIRDEGAKALALNTTLVSLNLTRNWITDEGAEALSRSSSLLYLQLFGNQLTDEGVLAFESNTSLICLGVWANFIHWRATVDSVIKRNTRRETERDQNRRLFLCAVLLLACDAVNANSRSFWHLLPADLRLCILQEICRASRSSLGAAPQTSLACAAFIARRIASLIELMQRRRKWRLVQKRDCSFDLAVEDSTFSIPVLRPQRGCDCALL